MLTILVVSSGARGLEALMVAHFDLSEGFPLIVLEEDSIVSWIFHPETLGLPILQFACDSVDYSGSIK
jgi:hypothetical protein